MQYLPKINYTPMNNPSSASQKCYSVDDSIQYRELQEIISEHVEGDCHAVTINGEILYNSYEPKSPRNKILDTLVRNQISENVHTSLFVELFRKNKHGKIVLYMFGTEATWFLIAYYNPITNLITLEYSKTAGYDKLIAEGNANLLNTPIII